MKTLLITKEAKAALDDLANLEQFNSYLYKNLAIVCQTIGLFGSEKFFLSESAEEITHYQDVVNFVNTRGGAVTLKPIEPFTEEFKDLGEMLKAAYDQEVYTENAYKKLIKEHGDDPVITQFGLEVLEHQYESVGEYGDLIARYALVKDNVIIFDAELGNL